MSNVRKIELLSPAKNLECGIEAINHGADAVYIGASRYGARASAGNTLEDIKTLTEYAHVFGVKIYVTVNTILKDNELDDTLNLIHELYKIGVDALIVQDLGLLKLNLPPIPLHASTQMDNRSVDKVQYLEKAGFEQVVLARELTLEEIRKIHEHCSVHLEAFVHGALCVSYSGQCYASQACFGRSANRGECAQFCRMAFDLEDAEGKVMIKNKHLLSLKDMNQSDMLEQMLDAGVSSFKIEGRLKDISYVKNVTAYYRQRIDAILSRRSEYKRASFGTVKFDFKPQLDKSFNRGFTHYFLQGRNLDMASVNTPKSIGEEMGTVKELKERSFTVSGLKSFNNGDGLCFFDKNGVLNGFRVNRVENNRLYPQEMPGVLPRTLLYRNFDQEFENLMSKKTAERKIALHIILAESPFGYVLCFTDEEGVSVSVSFLYKKELARTSQKENLCQQLEKLGNTPFEAVSTQIKLVEDKFIPSSVISEWRRILVDKLLQARRVNYHQNVRRVSFHEPTFNVESLSYLGNVMNEKAKQYYLEHGIKSVAWAFEREEPKEVPVMFCKYCIRYNLNGCPVYQGNHLTFKEPYYLVSKDGKRFRLEFDCKNCQMKIYVE